MHVCVLSLSHTPTLLLSHSPPRTLPLPLPPHQVLSAGGFGHVPLPLVKGELAYNEPPADFNYKKDVVFFGSLAQQGSTRPQIFQEMTTAMTEEKDADKRLSYQISDHNSDWKEAMINSRFNLVRACVRVCMSVPLSHTR